MFQRKNNLPSAEEVKRALPLSERLIRRKAHFDEEIKLNMQEGKRLTVVVGPCSADNVDAVTEYANRLSAATKVLPNLLTVLRVYTSKPHSDGRGYLGLAFQSSVNAEIDIANGIYSCRRLMLNCLEAGLPIADELLYPELYGYFDDLVSYWFLGARSSQDPLHRAFAAGADVAVGVKNDVSGNLSAAVQSAFAVKNPHTFPFDGKIVTTSGNKFAHLVLRGGFDGEYFSNVNLPLAENCLASYGCDGDFIMVDLGHGNSGKVAAKQIENARRLVAEKRVGGFMAESYLLGGVGEEFGMSKTDDCLNWNDTVELLEILNDGFGRRGGDR